MVANNLRLLNMAGVGLRFPLLESIIRVMLVTFLSKAGEWIWNFIAVKMMVSFFKFFYIKIMTKFNVLISWIWIPNLFLLYFQDPCSYSYKYKLLCGDNCTADKEGNKLAREINTSLKGCEKYCDRTKGCKSFTYCRGGSLCYVYDETLSDSVKTKGRWDRCNSYYRTCEPIYRGGK